MHTFEPFLRSTKHFTCVSQSLIHKVLIIMITFIHIYALSIQYAALFLYSHTWINILGVMWGSVACHKTLGTHGCAGEYKHFSSWTMATPNDKSHSRPQDLRSLLYFQYHNSQVKYTRLRTHRVHKIPFPTYIKSILSFSLDTFSNTYMKHIFIWFSQAR